MYEFFFVLVEVSLGNKSGIENRLECFDVFDYQDEYRSDDASVFGKIKFRNFFSDVAIDNH